MDPAKEWTESLCGWKPHEKTESRSMTAMVNTTQANSMRAVFGLREVEEKVTSIRCGTTQLSISPIKPLRIANRVALLMLPSCSFYTYKCVLRWSCLVQATNDTAVFISGACEEPQT